MRRLGWFALPVLFVLFAACSSSSSHHRRVRVVHESPAYHSGAKVVHVNRHVVTKCRDGRHVANCTCFKSTKKKPTVIIKSKRK